MGEPEKKVTYIDCTPKGVKENPERVDRAMKAKEEAEWRCASALLHLDKFLTDARRQEVDRLEVDGEDESYDLCLLDEALEAIKDFNRKTDEFLRAVAGLEERGA